MGILEPHGRGGSARRKARLSGRRIIVHSLDHARAAIDAAATLGVEVTIVSAAGAAGYAGPMWFKALVEAALLDHPDAAVTAILDCGEEPGTVLGALRAGLKHVRFTGPIPTRERLAALAAPLGAIIENDEPTDTLDLLETRDPASLCRAFLAGNKTVGRCVLGGD